MPRRLAELDPRWGSSIYERDGVIYAPEGIDDFDKEIHRPGCRQDPLFINGRQGMFVVFGCPVHYPNDCELGWMMVPFENPLDGGPKAREGQGSHRNHWWTRTGDTFETLSTTPSILFPESGPEHWHGFITNGLVTP